MNHDYDLELELIFTEDLFKMIAAMRTVSNNKLATYLLSCYEHELKIRNISCSIQ